MRLTHLFIMVLMLMNTVVASAQWNILFCNENNRGAIPVLAIDSLKPALPNFFDVFLKERTIRVPSDSVYQTQ